MENLPPSAFVPEVLKNKTNYERWSILMQHYLEAQDLWDVVSNEITCGRGNGRKWTKKNASALFAIKMSCESGLFKSIKDMRSAKEAWDFLAKKLKPTAVLPSTSGSSEITEHPEGPDQCLRSVQDELVNVIKKGDVRKLKEFFHGEGETTANFAKILENECTANQLDNARKLMKKPWEIKYLLRMEMPNCRDTDDAAARNALIRWKNKLLTTPDPNKKIPVQVACATSHEKIIRYLYKRTPRQFLNGDCGFDLLEECITKKIFDIALDLLKIFPELASDHRPSGSTPIISTLAQTPSLFRGRDKLVFWKGWIYNLEGLRAEIKYIKFKPEGVGNVEDQQRGEEETSRLKRFLSILSLFREILVVTLSEAVYFAAMLIPVEETSGLKRFVWKLLTFLWILVSPLLVVLRFASMLIPEVETSGPKGFVSKLLNFLWTLVRPLLVVLLFASMLIPAAVAAGLCAMFLIIRELVSIITGFSAAKQIRALKWMDLYANEVLLVICEQLSKLEPNEFGQRGAVEATFQAIKNGIPEIAINIIEKTKPEILWRGSDPEDSSRNMFMCAVAHRQEEVARFLYGFDASKYTSTETNMVLTSDEEGNNILHLAAKLASLSQLGRISGAALQLQSELRWFKAVESIVPRSYNECKNKDDETPSQVFAREHKDLLKDAEEWMKKMAESSTVVGALIITIMFAAAFTVPGGNDQNLGFPIFLPKKPVPFMVFIVSDAISLFAASSSVLMFLGILTSRYAYEDFLKSLPIKLIIGLSSLFISIATMTTAFCAAVFIMLQDHQLWGAILITLLACIPVTFFVLLQFPLLAEIYRSTSSPDIFDRERSSLITKLSRNATLWVSMYLFLMSLTLVTSACLAIKRLTRES